MLGAAPGRSPAPTPEPLPTIEAINVANDKILVPRYKRHCGTPGNLPTACRKPTPPNVRARSLPEATQRAGARYSDPTYNGVRECCQQMCRKLTQQAPPCSGNNGSLGLSSHNPGQPGFQQYLSSSPLVLPIPQVAPLSDTPRPIRNGNQTRQALLPGP